MRQIYYYISIIIVIGLFASCSNDNFEQDKLVGKWVLKMISYDIESNDSDTDLLIVNKIKEQYRLQVGDSIEFTSKNTYKDKWDDEMSYSLKNNSIDFTPPPMSSLIMLPVNYISDGKILTLSIDYSKNGERIIFENMGVDFSKASIDKVIIYYSFTKL